MSKDNYFFKKSNFTLGNFFTGLLKDTPDKRDYQFSDLIKQQKKIKTVKIKTLKPKPLKRGTYRKHGYQAPLHKVKISVNVPVATTTPSKVDHSQNVSSIKNQGSLGSCVAFAAAAMKECQEKKEHYDEVKSGKKYSRSEEYDYSEQWLYWNCKKIDGIPESEGTYIRTVMKVLNKIGVPAEKAWPYTDDSISIGKPKSWANLVARWAVVGSYWSVGNLTELKIALVDGPVIIGVPVFAEWWRPPNGIINYPSQPSQIYGGHAICVIGYDDNKQLIKFKNSWGTWGDQGYGYLSYRYINDFLWSAWVARDIAVKRDMLKGTREL